MHPYYDRLLSLTTSVRGVSLTHNHRNDSGEMAPLNHRRQGTSPVYPSVTRVLGWGMVCLVIGSLSLGCSSTTQSSPSTSVTPSRSAEETDAQEVTRSEGDGSGLLILTANGEDFVRQGVVSKDGWAIAFDHVYLTLTDVVAYQTDPAYDAKTSHEITNITQKVTVQESPITIDLAAGDADADPIVVNTVSAPAGHYNALSWALIPDPSGDPKGYSIHLLGTATKAEQTIQFSIGLDETFYYSCGEYIGDSRKGILKSDQSTSVEITLHFDHIFGDGGTSLADGDEVTRDEATDEDVETKDVGMESANDKALGFDPLAALAQDNRLNVDASFLKTALSPEHQAQLDEASAGLGHVGEGHCAVPTL